MKSTQFGFSEGTLLVHTPNGLVRFARAKNGNVTVTVTPTGLSLLTVSKLTSMHDPVTVTLYHAKEKANG